MSIKNDMIRFAEMVKTRQSLSDFSGKAIFDSSREKFYEAEKILDHLNKSIGADVIGASSGFEGNYVFGKDRVPWGVLALRNVYNNKKAISEWQWTLHSKHIEKSKGPREATRSNSCTGIINFLRKKIVRPLSFEDTFAVNSLAPIHIKKLEIEEGATEYRPKIELSVVRDFYDHITDGSPVTDRMKVWADNVRPGYESSQRYKEKLDRTKQAFRTKSIILSQVGYTTDKPVHVQFMELPVGGSPVFSGSRFVASVKDLVEYPHIVGVNNLVKLEHGSNDSIFDALGSGYSKKYNLIRFTSTGVNYMMATSLIFPYEFMEEPSQTVEEKPVDNDGIFSLDI